MKSNLFIEFCPYCGYKLVRKMLEGRERLYCSRCGKIYYENPTPVVAVI
ncbi:MAG: zinc ribbon domain-containing protein, partial [Atribacterota bacterium]|nr:zinc ribbon domain-containing protein [Atribacterota bacterium]